MSALKNTKLMPRLVISFLIVALIGLVIGLIGILSLHTLNEEDDAMFNYGSKPMGDLALMYDTLATQRICIANMLIFRESNPEFAKSEEASLAEKEALFEQALANYGQTLVPGNTTDEGYYASISKSYNDNFGNAKSNFMKAYTSGKSAEIEAAMEQIDSSGSDVSGIIDEAFAFKNQICVDQLNSNTDLYKTRSIIMIAIIAIGLVLSVFFSSVIAHTISRPINRILVAMKQVGDQGNLNFPDEIKAVVKKDSECNDEIGQMTKAFIIMMDALIEKTETLGIVAAGDLTAKVRLASENDTIGNALLKMIDSLNDMFSEIGRVTVHVSVGAAQIADGAQLLAQGTTEQAATVEHLSESISDVAGKTDDNAKRAELAAELAETIKANAQKGSEQMERMMQAVKDINDASMSIGKVIKVIDDIAFQTNILALNAAVEAARAGQHGKGFAVVADEVRNLAAKSAVAAKDTSSLIANSISKAELGTRIADETATSLNEIVSGIVESSKIVNEISDSSELQSSAIVEINKGIQQVAQVVQQNSATAEQSAASSQEMSSQSSILRELVSQFNLREKVAPGIKKHSLPVHPDKVDNSYDSYNMEDYGKY